MGHALPAGYWALVFITLRAKSFRETVEWLNAIEKNLVIQFKDLTALTIYAEFVKSPEYESGAKSRKN